MEPIVQEPYNMFTQLTKSVGVYDPNQGWRGTPSAENIIAAQRTPQAQLRSQQGTPVMEQQQKAIDPNSSTAGMEYLNSLYTSPDEENRLRKASVANQRILAVGDALRHIGNIFHTVNYAPSQQFNQPWAEEQARYERGKALRDKANLTYLTYQQQKAAQDAKMRQLDQQFRYNMEKDAREYALKKNESDARAKLNEARILNQNTLAELNKLKEAGIISDNEWREQRAKLYPTLTQSQIDRNNRTGGSRSGGSRSGGVGEYQVSETKTYNRNADGQVESVTTNKSRTKAGQTSSSTKTTNKSNVSNFSIRNKNTKEKNKTNVGRFSIHK